MAQDVVVKESLSEGMVRSGADLTRQLDEAGWPVTASLWLYDPDSNQWRLLLASPTVGTGGPRKAYAAIQDVLSAASGDAAALALDDVGVLPDDDSLVQLLRAAMATGPGIAGTRFNRNVINGRFIEDAYIYRV